MEAPWNVKRSLQIPHSETVAMRCCRPCQLGLMTGIRLAPPVLRASLQPSHMPITLNVRFRASQNVVKTD